MSNTVLKLTLSEIEKMKQYYHTYLVEKLPPGSVFSAKPTGCTITAYKSGKVLFQGGSASSEAAKWGSVDENSPAKSTPSSSKPKAALPDNIASLSLLGSDEVGTGDYFGPITVVASYVSKEQIPLLKELGVKDSKGLNDEKICAIAKQIIQFVPYSLLTLHNEKYNDMQAKGMSQGKMKALLHNKAITNLLEKIQPEKPEAILIDQFAEKDIYYRHLKGQKVIQTENVYFSTKAEGIHIAVAAASIIARYAFVQHFEKLSSKAGFVLPKGAGAHVDKAAARLILAKGEEALYEFTKVHFANTGKAKKIAKV